MHTKFDTKHDTKRGAAPVLALLGLLALGGCGGGGEPDSGTAAPVAAPFSFQVDTGEASPADPGAEALPRVEAPDAVPYFHAAPVLLDAPDDGDAQDNTASTRQAPHRASVPGTLNGLDSRGLTVERIEEARRIQMAERGGATPQAAASTVTTFTPAQIRAAYGLPALPAAGAVPGPAQAAQLGAGQTIYIVNARHNPNVAAELKAFNDKFGLPACALRPIPPGTRLPLAAASATEGCVLSVAYSTTAGALTATAPAYESGWATEIALDVQWAHATAPLARIVLIEAPDASVNSLAAAVRLANAMGPGVVSMSFGAAEGNWTASLDSSFSAAGMTYLAATGDSGVAVSWPSVSPRVIAVGGTTLGFNGASRSETTWTQTGGGISQYVATPAYQQSGLPGGLSPVRRTVADVAFNADPSSGQYVAVMAPGTTTPKWISAGGTSLSTPQWAGIVAAANAVRAQQGKAALGGGHGTLYGQVASVPGLYAAAFADIRTGRHGSCGTCAAQAGYDQATGLGTPNVTALLAALADPATTPAPVVSGAAISGRVGTPLSFTPAVTAANPLGFSLTGAPAGMTISAAGVVSWPVPQAGTWTVTVVARDTRTGLSGQGVFTVTVAPASAAPVVAGGTVSGKAGSALSFAVKVTAPGPVSYALAGAPAGMVISTAGIVSWPAPVAGTYTITVSARDTRSGLTGTGTWTVSVAAAPAGGLQIQAPALNGVAGKALSGSIGLLNPAGGMVSVSISGVPAGMSLALSGATIRISWARPVTGRYTLAISARNSAGQTAQASLPVTIAAR